MEDVLTSGLSAKLMRYLRIRALGETSLNQKDAPYSAESKTQLLLIAYEVEMTVEVGSGNFQNFPFGCS